MDWHSFGMQPTSLWSYNLLYDEKEVAQNFVRLRKIKKGAQKLTN